MTLPFRVLLTVAAAGGAAAGSVGAGASQRGCSGTQSPGVCLWPNQQAFANLSVAGDEDMGTACCSACSAESRCVSWLVYTEPHSSYPAGTCILNDHQVMGQAPPLPACISGHVPPKPWPAPPPVPAPPGAKNVLFFAVDDLRPEINAFGGGRLGPLIPGSVAPKMHTPHFDELAQTSLVLTKNYVQQAVCSPTRTSLLTGRRPDRTRVFDLYSYFRTVAANYTTIPEFFRLHGYETIGMGKIFHPGHASGGARAGSDDACCSWSNASAYFHAPNLGAWSGTDVASTHSDGKAWFSVPGPLEAKFPLPDNQTADHAVQTLRALAEKHVAGAKKPWFVAVGFHKPHLPFVASEQFFDDFYPPSEIELPPNQQPPEGMPPVAWSSYGEIRAYSDIKSLNATGAPGTVLPKQDVLDLRRAYYASVTQTDFMLGKVMAELKSGPFASNTVVSIWGDHGWQLGEHGEWCKHTNFEFATRAPMMIHVPGLTDAGIVTTHYSEHVDLFPTLAEAAAGITLTPCPKGDASVAVALCTEGSSLVPLMRNPQTPVKTAAFSQYPRGYQRSPGRTNGADNTPDMYTTTGSDLFGGEMSAPGTSPCIMDREETPGCTMGYTVITRLEGSEYRYTEWADFNTPGYELRVDWSRNVGVELYNHSSDPGENFNLNATQKGNEAIHSLSAKLSALLRAGPSYGTSNP